MQLTKLDPSTIANIIVVVAAIIGAFAGAILAYYSSWRIKRFETKLQEKKERATERLKFHIPFLRLCSALDRRIGRLLLHLNTDWLDYKYLEKINRGEGFAADQKEIGYFFISSVYLFACFFGWSEAVKKRIDSMRPYSERKGISRIFSISKRRFTEKLGIQKVKHTFIFDRDISAVSKLFQYEEFFKIYLTKKKFVTPRDAAYKLHKQLQYSIGELMLIEDGLGNFRCKTFREFLEKYVQDEKFRYWFFPIVNLLADLSHFQAHKDIETQSEMKNDIRPLRILAIRYWIRVLMQNMSKELGINLPLPDEVLKGDKDREAVSDELKEAIKSFSIEEVDTFRLGVDFSNE